MATKTYCKSKSQELENRDWQNFKKWETKNKVPQKHIKEIKGRLLPYMIEEEIDNEEIMKQFKVEDFALENLIETGAINNLHEMKAIEQTLNTIDNLNANAALELHRMDAEEWYNKYIEKTNKSKTNNEEK